MLTKQGKGYNACIVGATCIGMCNVQMSLSATVTLIGDVIGMTIDRYSKYRPTVHVGFQTKTMFLSYHVNLSRNATN